MLLTALLTLGTTLLSSTGLVAGAAGALQQVTSFGANPTNVGMFVYKPAQLASPTPLIVAMHFCTGTAQIFFSGTQFADLADTHGFVVVYPNAPDSGGCWDVHTNATLTHDAGGDSLGIASMVRYAIASYGVDPRLVFMTGSSSGAMMTNVLAGAYPDLFQAGVAFSGVPYSCFSGPTLWNSACADGDIIMTPQQWVSVSTRLRLPGLSVFGLSVDGDLVHLPSRAPSHSRATQAIPALVPECSYGTAPRKHPRIIPFSEAHADRPMTRPATRRFSTRTLAKKSSNGRTSSASPRRLRPRRTTLPPLPGLGRATAQM